MKVASQTPDYLPETAYFYRMARADRFVIADDILIGSSGMVNRCRIKSAAGEQPLTVPVVRKGKSRQLIRDVRIDGSRHWGKKHWRSLYLNYRYAPYFEYYADFFQDLYRRDWRFLLDLNLEIIHYLRKALGIATPLQMASELGLGAGATRRIVEMMQKLSAGAYLAPPEHATFLDVSAFSDAGLKLEFAGFTVPPYRQQFGAFVPHLSVVDLLFNEGPAAKAMLRLSPVPDKQISADSEQSNM